MSQLIVNGPSPLQGEFEVPGAKNSVSKLLAASMLASDDSEFTNAPCIEDISVTEAICEALGATIERSSQRVVRIRTPEITDSSVPQDMARRNRLSVMMIAPLLHRYGSAEIASAGGDQIGPRPVDFHLDAYRQMGADVTVESDVYCLMADRLTGTDITLPYPSVSATVRG